LTKRTCRCQTRSVSSIRADHDDHSRHALARRGALRQARAGMTASQAHLDLGFGEAPPVRSQDTRLPQLAAAREPSGVVYTQTWVVDLILDLAGYRADQDLAARYAVEPSAGKGAFLGPMIRRLPASLPAHGRHLADARDRYAPTSLMLTRPGTLSNWRRGSCDRTARAPWRLVTWPRGGFGWEITC
jgi:hypothetical protein